MESFSSELSRPWPELAEELGLGRDDGVVLAWIPTLDQVPVGFAEAGAMWSVFEVAEEHGDYMLVDAEPKFQPMKWWKVKAAARSGGYSHPEPVWTGPIEELRVECFPQMSRAREGLQLALRAYQRGPWVTNLLKAVG